MRGVVLLTRDSPCEQRVTGLGPRDETQSAAAGGAPAIPTAVATAPNRSIRKRCLTFTAVLSRNQPTPTSWCSIMTRVRYGGVWGRVLVFSGRAGACAHLVVNLVASL